MKNLHEDFLRIRFYLHESILQYRPAFICYGILVAFLWIVGEIYFWQAVLFIPACIMCAVLDALLTFWLERPREPRPRTYEEWKKHQSGAK